MSDLRQISGKILFGQSMLAVVLTRLSIISRHFQELMPILIRWANQYRFITHGLFTLMD
jgi:hypothetical protein